MMKLLRSFLYAWNGLKFCLTTQLNFRIHLFLAALTIFTGIYFDITRTEWIIIIICIAIVMVTEILNTSIEKLADVVHLAIHPEIKLVKDIAAGAVLLAAIGSAVSGAIIFLPKFFVLIKSL